MNRTMLKKISLYVTGFVLGGGVGYLLADHFVTKAERILEGYPDVDEETEETVEVEKLKQESKWVPEAAAEKKEKKKKGKPQPTDYTKFANQDNKKSLSEEVKTRIGGEVEEEKMPSGINIITLEIYADPVPIRDKVVLTYYEEDNTLVDEEETVIDDRNRLIGNALEKFGTEKDGDPDTVYVRNGKTKTDYEIVRVKGSYSEIALGEKPKKKTKPRVRRTTKKTSKLEEDDE